MCLFKLRIQEFGFRVWSRSKSLMGSGHDAMSEVLAFSEAVVRENSNVSRDAGCSSQTSVCTIECLRGRLIAGIP